jgi:hypothetical protein
MPVAEPIARPGAAMPVADPSAGIARTRFVTQWRCRAGGGVVGRSLTSPTKLRCYGGVYNGYWGLGFGL